MKTGAFLKKRKKKAKEKRKIFKGKTETMNEKGRFSQKRKRKGQKKRKIYKGKCSVFYLLVTSEIQTGIVFV